MKKIKEQTVVFILLGIMMIILAVYSFLSKGSYAGADDVNHYFIARYSWQLPHLLLDHWGKPLFTLIASPFAQFGNIGTKMMNVILSILSAFFVYKTVKILDYKNAWLSVIILLFFPVFFVMSLSGNIEIMGAFILILSTYFYIRKNPVMSNIILSFMIFVRTETFIFFPIYALANILNRQYKAIPFLITGFLIYSLAGMFYYDDFLWVFTKVPYSKDAAEIETGSLFHYIDYSKTIFGILLTVFIGIGLIYLIINLFRKQEKIINTRNINEIIIITAPLLAYFVAHSYSYWKGVVGGMSGNVRIMASVAPLAAVIALYGINNVLDLVKIKFVQIIILTGILIVLVITPDKVYNIPVTDYKDMELMRKAAKWFKGTEYFNNYLVYGDRRFAELFDINPYDAERSRWYVHSSVNPEKFLPDGTIYIWDAHFSTYYEKVYLENILQNKNFRLINVFKPEIPFKVRGGFDYALCFFQKVPYNDSVDNEKAYHEIIRQKEEEFNDFYTLDFESMEDSTYQLVSNSFKGNYAAEISGEYEVSLKISGEKLEKVRSNYSMVKASINVSSVSPDSLKNIFLVCSYEKDGKIYNYFNTGDFTPDTVLNWYKMELICKVPSVKKKYNQLKIYLRNSDHNKIVVDNFKVMLR